MDSLPAVPAQYFGESTGMIKGLMDWIDDRSGIRGLVKEALYEKVPGGALLARLHRV